MVWARTLLERLETKSRVGGVEVKIGLLPALADSDRKDQVQRFRDELAGWVEAEGYLAGFVLHIGRLHGGTPSFMREQDGRVRFLMTAQPGQNGSPAEPQRSPRLKTAEYRGRAAEDTLSRARGYSKSVVGRWSRCAS